MDLAADHPLSPGRSNFILTIHEAMTYNDINFTPQTCCGW